MTAITWIWIAIAVAFLINMVYMTALHSRVDKLKENKGERIDYLERVGNTLRQDIVSGLRRISFIEQAHKYDPHWRPLAVIAGTLIAIVREGEDPHLDPTRKELLELKNKVTMLLSHLKLEEKTTPKETKLVTKK